MYDRAMQALYALTLDPVAETVISKPTFGFRKHRSGKDAASYIYNCMSQKTCATWVLEGDIKGCFDNISHQWLFDNIPMNKRVLRKFLKAGYIYKKDMYPTENGTPQGGIISPILANLTLSGLAELLTKRYSSSPKGTISRKYNTNKIHTIVYADDFIITASNEEILHQVKQDIETFLRVRGLELSTEKTIITHINNGFDFLGWTFRKFNNKLIITPSKKSVKKVCKKIIEVVRVNLMQKQEVLIRELNAIIRGWSNYHKNICAKSTFQSIDKVIFETLWRWVKRRHPMKSMGWRKKRYFTQTATRDWIFESRKNKMLFASDTKIVRHVLIKFEANPYMQECEEYYRMRKRAVC
jgi:RNA-directed DNA polymerase